MALSREPLGLGRMLERFEFEELESPDEFARLCSDVLEAEGGENLRGFGKAADQGSDFLVDIPDQSPLGRRTTTYRCSASGGVRHAPTSSPHHAARRNGRATTGLTPDGFAGVSVDASRFLSNQAQLRAVQRAQTIFRQTGRRSFSFQMEGIIGEGYLRGGVELVETTNVQAVFRNGQLFTIYPLLSPLP